MFQKCFALAARLQAQKQQSYSLTELTQIGAEANIPPEFIQKAIQQIQAKQAQAHERQQKLKVGLISAGVGSALWGLWAGKMPLAQGHCTSMMSKLGEQNSQSR